MKVLQQIESRLAAAELRVAEKVAARVVRAEAEAEAFEVMLRSHAPKAIVELSTQTAERLALKRSWRMAGVLEPLGVIAPTT